MEELISGLGRITADMQDALGREDYSELDRLLEKRQSMMKKVDDYKDMHPDFTFSSKETRFLKEILSSDQTLAEALKRNIVQNITERLQLKEKNKATEKYNLYQKQINGAFIDTTK